MNGVTPATKGFFLILAMGITSVTLVPLGIVFTILGVTDTGEFPLALGLGLLALGLADAGFALYLFLSGRARRRREEAARVSHGTAQVVEAKHDWDSQIGARHPVKLTVELAGGRHTRALFVPPHVNWKPGQTISVAYEPNAPANFVPVGGK